MQITLFDSAWPMTRVRIPTLRVHVHTRTVVRESCKDDDQ